MNLFDRLFSKAMIQENGCWEFFGARNYGGYGQIRDSSGRSASAHRVAYDLCVGDIPKGMLVLHSCDNPPCVNPAHLFLGTAQDNMDDMAAKGRKVIIAPEELPQTKLTAKLVSQIREKISGGNITGKELAYQYGVSQQTICDIKARRTWASIGRLS